MSAWSRVVRVSLAFVLVLGFASATQAQLGKPSNKVLDQRPAPTGIKKLIVVNFLVPEGVVKEKKGLLGREGGGPLRRALRGDDGDSTKEIGQQDSALLATTLVDKLNDIDELKKLGITAERDDLPTGTTATDTLVVDGAFLYVDEGNRLMQTGVGFGAGASKVEIEMELLDYSKTPPEQVMKVGSHSNPRRGPGAILMMNPYVAAAKFVLSKNSSEKDIKKVAGGLAKEIAKFLASGAAASKP